MSFVDLATLTMHRRAEMEGRINIFDQKCDHAINDIKKLKMQVHTFVAQLNCEPTELKERFLTFMKKLDEYMYLITDFNLAMGQIEDAGCSEYTPVQDTPVQSLPPVYNFNTNNLMDALSEPAPCTSCACSNLCPPEKPKRAKVPKEEQTLIAFSSSSTSSESVPSGKSGMVTKEVQCTEMETKEVQCSLTEEIGTLKIEAEAGSLPSAEPCNLPAQAMLEVDHKYPGVITAIAGACFWIITDDQQDLHDFMFDITEYYQANKAKLTLEEAKSLTCCAYYDEETNFFYRALYIKEDEEEADKVSLFLVDTGELRSAAVDRLQPLSGLFSERPPYARFCHLAGVDLISYHNKDLVEKYENFMNEYVNAACTFQVDDNSSESIGVYVILPSGEILNDILVQRGLALPIDKCPPPDMELAVNRTPPGFEKEKSPPLVCGPPELANSELDLTECPEYEDPVEAVTGYHNRDEADICKHYKGGPDKHCFKGSRCTKKHILKHPDGWTLDRVSVIGKCKSVPLPAPGTWHKVFVTHVCHFDRAYVHIVTDKPKEEVPDFGIVLPPTTLEGLCRDMNSAAARLAYKPLQLTPAPGELVAAMYPPDGSWYRARVLTVTRADQSVEVMYVDYGTVLWVKEDQIRVLEPRFAVLPMQAVRCLLAGVFITAQNSHQWAKAKRALADMVQDRTLLCHVIARDYDEITVELLDDQDFSVAHQLAAQDLVELREYSVCDDAHVTQKAVVP